MANQIKGKISQIIGPVIDVVSVMWKQFRQSMTRWKLQKKTVKK